MNELFNPRGFRRLPHPIPSLSLSPSRFLYLEKNKADSQKWAEKTTQFVLRETPLPENEDSSSVKLELFVNGYLTEKNYQ